MLTMSVVACRVNLFTHTTHVDSIRMSVVACRVNHFTHTTCADSIRMSVVRSLQKENITYCSYMARGCISLQYKKHTEYICYIYKYTTCVGLTEDCPNKLLSTKCSRKWHQYDNMTQLWSHIQFT